VTLFLTSSLAVFEAAIRVKSTDLIKSCLKTRKKRKMGIKEIFYINLNLSDLLDIEFPACYGELMPQESLTSFTANNAYRQFAVQA